MGQRLVIAVREKGEDLAAMYFEWSAYSELALREAQDFIAFLESAENRGMDPRLVCIRYCEQRGGSIDNDVCVYELAYVQSLFPGEAFKTDGCEDDGLVSLSPKGMEYRQAHSERTVYIDLDTRTVQNNVLWSYSGWSKFNDYMASWCENYVPITDENKHERAVITDFDVISFPFDDIEDVRRVAARAEAELIPIESCGRVYETLRR